MIQVIRHLTSWNNFKRCRNPRGQMATFLILGMIVLLAFVLATVNIGNSSVQSTVLSNAADSAVLQLGGQLATRSYQMWESMDYRIKKCKKRGFWSIILAIVGAIIAIWIAPYLMGTVATFASNLVAGAIGGMIGGMAGAAIDGTSILGGALLGLSIGLAIGGLASGITGVNPTGFAALEGTALAVPQEAIIALQTGWKGIMWNSTSLASTIYNEVAAMRDWEKALDRFVKALNGMDEKTSYREMAFLTAFKQVVDDPTLVTDTTDVDGDGNYLEYVPRFLNWWDQRKSTYVNVSSIRIPEVDSFKVYAREFADFLGDEVFGYTCDIWDRLADNCYETEVNVAGSLERLDYEYQIYFLGDLTSDAEWIVREGDKDGSIVGWLRAVQHLRRFDQYITDDSVWLEGPTPYALNQYDDLECLAQDPDDPYEDLNCPDPPAGYDMVDLIADQSAEAYIFLTQFSWSSSLTVATMWDFVRNQLLEGDVSNPDTDSDAMYGQLRTNMAKLQLIKERMQAVAYNNSDLVPCMTGAMTQLYDWEGNPTYMSCEYCSSGGWWDIWTENCGTCMQTTPCLDYAYSPPDLVASCYAYNVDDPETEEVEMVYGCIRLTEALADIDTLIAKMDEFSQRILTFVNAMDSVDLSVGVGLTGYCGTSCLQYSWEDIRGNHAVKVDIGPFKLAYIKKKSSWSKVCLYLRDYEDDDNCWVRITRQDSSRSLGALGRWNPFNRGITKVSYAEYPGSSFDYVGIKRVTL